MKTGKIVLAGEERTLCFSTRVVRSCTERYGDISNIGEALSNTDRAKVLDECLWLMAQLMDAGARYCAHNGISCAKPLTVDDLLDCCDISEFSGMSAKIMETIRDSSAADVEAETKNAEAIQENGKA